MNLGLVLGGVAKGATDTYTTLQAQNRANQAAADEHAAELQKQQELHNAQLIQAQADTDATNADTAATLNPPQDPAAAAPATAIPVTPSVPAQVAPAAAPAPAPVAGQAIPAGPASAPPSASPPVAAPVVAGTSDPGAPRGIRNNNWGNIMALPQGHEWEGQTGTDPGGYAQFATPLDGIKAATQNLKAYAAKGINTVADVIARWQPSATVADIQQAASSMGVTPTTKLNISDPKVTDALTHAIFTMANGGAAYHRALAQLDPDTGAPIAPPPPSVAEVPPRGSPAAAPLDPHAKDMLTRLVLGEDPKNGKAVASTVYNRANESGQSLTDVMTAPHQFEPIGNPATWAKLQAVDPKSAAYQQAAADVQYVHDHGSTINADHFYAPGTQAALGRTKPAWDNGSGTAIGSQLYFKLGYDGKGITPGAQSPSAPASAAPVGSTPAYYAGGIPTAYDSPDGSGVRVTYDPAYQTVSSRDISIAHQLAANARAHGDNVGATQIENAIQQRQVDANTNNQAARAEQIAKTVTALSKVQTLGDYTDVLNTLSPHTYTKGVINKDGSGSINYYSRDTGANVGHTDFANLRGAASELSTMLTNPAGAQALYDAHDKLGHENRKTDADAALSTAQAARSNADIAAGIPAAQASALGAQAANLQQDTAAKALQNAREAQIADLREKMRTASDSDRAVMQQQATLLESGPGVKVVPYYVNGMPTSALQMMDGSLQIPDTNGQLVPTQFAGKTAPAIKAAQAAGVQLAFGSHADPAHPSAPPIYGYYDPTNPKAGVSADPNTIVNNALKAKAQGKTAIPATPGLPFAAPQSGSERAVNAVAGGLGKAKEAVDKYNADKAAQEKKESLLDWFARGAAN